MKTGYGLRVAPHPKKETSHFLYLQTNCRINWALLAGPSAWDSLAGWRNNHKYTNLCNWVALFCLSNYAPASPPLRSSACPFAFPCKCAEGEPSSSEQWPPFQSEPKNMQPIFMTMRNNWLCEHPHPIQAWPCHQPNQTRAEQSRAASPRPRLEPSCLLRSGSSSGSWPKAAPTSQALSHRMYTNWATN